MEHRDPAGFAFLVARYEHRALHHARSWLGSSEEARDACQDAFAKAYASLPRLRELTEFYPWFYRILRNHCLNLLERRRTVARHAQRYPQRENDPDADPALIAETHDEQARERSALYAALAAVKPEAREILTLKYVAGMPYDEIASLLGIPRGTVMSRLYHARKALGRLLEPDDDVRTGAVDHG